MSRRLPDGGRVLLTGGSGFIGGAVLRQLESGRDAPPLRVLVNRRAPVTGRGAAELVPADLADPASLRGVCSGVHTVLHLASQIGGSPGRLRQVNRDGTAALLAEAAAAGVRRVVYLSTTAVYRDGVHRDLTEYQPDLRPGSETSRSRLAAERLVLAAGGTVLRPHLVYGAGDRWVVPALAELLRRLPHWIDGGRARMSVIAVEDLARPIAALARTDWGPVPGGRVLHAADPEPVRIGEFATALCEGLGLPLPEGELTLEQARRRLGADWDRRLSLLAVDHWYRSSRLWRLTGCEPGPGPSARLAGHLSWYRELLGGAAGPSSVAA
ncbi:NAD-dependent epimerase/dehydratase family protein [Kitasatospora sp. NPDC051853]|uniref:NAD-dependent epimerase/dehydratase family protein n=1 Tax=Kitasatospora sp. NPDC051853 TaxID=3364058 RepID=UPI0037B413C0